MTIDIKTAINSAGLVLTIIGAYVVFVNSPLNVSVIDGGGPSTDFEEISRAQIRKNLLMKVGVGLVLIGTAAQLVSNYVPSTSC